MRTHPSSLRKRATGLAAALALSSTGAFANTLLFDGASGNGSVFLNVADYTTSWSYVFDTGLRVSDFLASTSTSRSCDFSTDANWLTFKSNITNVNGPDQVLYNVVALNAVAPSNYSALVTSAAPTGTTAGNVGATTNSNLRQFNAVNPYINAVNQVNSASTNSAVVSQASNDPAYFGTSFQANWFARAQFDTTASIDSALAFYGLSLNGVSNLTRATVTTFPGTWNLSSAGVLSYNASPVPAPGAIGLLGTAISSLAFFRAKKRKTTTA